MLDRTLTVTAFAQTVGKSHDSRFLKLIILVPSSCKLFGMWQSNFCRMTDCPYEKSHWVQAQHLVKNALKIRKNKIMCR